MNFAFVPFLCVLCALSRLNFGIRVQAMRNPSLRDALPNGSFIGFTGTASGKADANPGAAHAISTTRGPSTSSFGVMPRPGAVLADMKPFTRCGAPVAVLTVT